MNTDFLPKKYFDIGSALGGSTPWGAIAQEGMGIIQSVLGGIKQHKAIKSLEKLQTPTYKPNQGILDYYNQSLARYGASPTDTALYKRQTKNIMRGTAQGLGMLQDRRAGQAGVPGLIQAQNDAMLNAEVAAEGEKNRRFGELGSATGMKAGEERAAFQQNEIAPYEKKYNLLAMKAGGGAQQSNAGVSNIFGGLNTMSQIDMLNKMYSNGGGNYGTGDTNTTATGGVTFRDIFNAAKKRGFKFQ